jgi:hypothetical protein
VFFDRLYLDTDDVVDDRLAEPFDDFLYHAAWTGGAWRIRADVA